MSCSHVTHCSCDEILATSTRTSENLEFSLKEASFMWSNVPYFISTCENSDPQPVAYKLLWCTLANVNFEIQIKCENFNSHWNHDFWCEKAKFHMWQLRKRIGQARCVFLLVQLASHAEDQCSSNAAYSLWMLGMQTTDQLQLGRLGESVWHWKCRNAQWPLDSSWTMYRNAAKCWAHKGSRFNFFIPLFFVKKNLKIGWELIQISLS